MPIPIPNLLMQPPMLWKCVGFVSSVIGLVSYALSSSFTHLFGEWNLLKILIYAGFSLIICSIMLFAKKRQLSRSFLLKSHVGFLVLMLASLYSSFYDKSMNGKPDVLSLISSGAFALMSLSLSRQIELGFEVGVSNFFAGCLTVQLMKINLLLAFVAVVFCYSLIVTRCYLDSHPQIGNGNLSSSQDDPTAIVIELATSSGSDINDNRQHLRRRRNMTQQNGEEVYGLEEEIERLKRDKNVIMQEIERQRQRQQTSEGQLMEMESKFSEAAEKEKRIMDILSKAISNPSFVKPQDPKIRRKRKQV
ncbi:Calmodulin-binding transcription activator 5 [Senna tora]|uniref:Calmodulin-binding transcription activator 5 n=1 Tax=Senna tora TaxID=362788 RepID=A0A834WCM8_9FABA|nr:Calmodulin-binding transcription activator 5 [Senna tora]